LKGSITCLAVSAAGTVWPINGRLSITRRTITEAFDHFARSTAQLAAFQAAFDPAVETRIFEITNPPINSEGKRLGEKVFVKEGKSFPEW
jgi:hypothetical protein